MFQVQHRIVVADGRFEQPLSVIGCCRKDNLNTWRVEEPGCWAGGMEWATVNDTSGRAANDDGDGHTRTPGHLARHVDDLVEAAGDEVDKLHLGDGTKTHERRTYSGADDSGFSHRGIDDTLRSKLFQQASADFERTAVDAHVFTKQEHCLVTLHL